MPGLAIRVMKPTPDSMPKSRAASASRCVSVARRKRESGVTPKGCSRRLRCLRSILILCDLLRHRDDYGDAQRVYNLGRSVEGRIEMVEGVGCHSGCEGG